MPVQNPSLIRLLVSPFGVVITGVPHANASIATRLKDSRELGVTTTSEERYSSMSRSPLVTKDHPTANSQCLGARKGSVVYISTSTPSFARASVRSFVCVPIPPRYGNKLVKGSELP